MLKNDPRSYMEESPKLHTTIVRFAQLSDSAKEIFLPQLKEIFFHSSSVKQFRDDTHRREFFQKWCGDYLDFYPEFFYLMVDDKSNLLAYLCVCPDTLKGMERLQLKSLVTFTSEYTLYPAHLHMNTHQDYRGLGLGAMILAGVEADLRMKGIKGLHLITEKSSRNYQFYFKQGFQHVVEKDYQNTLLCFMGKDLNS